MSTPHWAKEVDQDEQQSLRQNDFSNEIPILKTKSPCYYYGLKVITMLLCGMMATCSILGLAMLNGIDDLGKVFVGVYMLFFSSLLFLFELVQVQPWESVDHMFQRNFGFLYSAKGKAFYIIFIAFLSFGLGEPATLCLVTGCLMAIFGIGSVLLYLQNPDLFEI